MEPVKRISVFFREEMGKTQNEVGVFLQIAPQIQFLAIFVDFLTIGSSEPKWYFISSEM